MNRTRLLKLRLGAGLALAVAALYVLVSVAGAADASAKKARKQTRTKLTGAELYAINCNRCHPERYPTEWTAAQWQTLILHMRVRANLPAKQAREILKYLQENSRN
jgi:mono/diheme cytochrome c family protein